MSSVLVVYSGGLDSYTLLNKAMKKFDRIEAITFNYGQKHNKEIEYAKSNCAELNIKHEVVNLDLENILAGSALVGDIDIPEGNYDKEKMKQTIVPNRNMIMISVAASTAIRFIFSGDDLFRSFISFSAYSISELSSVSIFSLSLPKSN